MVASALFIMDLKGKIIISRNFRGDIPMTVSDRCVPSLVPCALCHVFVKWNVGGVCLEPHHPTHPPAP